ncbi:MAG: hypothetical protein ACREBS_08060 [Nitrososphaerales archaeon]
MSYPNLQYRLNNAHGLKPENVFADAWKAYQTTIPKTVGAVNHVAKCGIVKVHATNIRIERANNTVRERTKVQRVPKCREDRNLREAPDFRGSKNPHHNFAKPHM